MVADACTHSALLLALVLLASPAGVAGANEAYKSIDADGHIVYSDQPDVSTGAQSAPPIEISQTPPPLIHFCWTNCFTLQLDHGLYTRVDGTDETWTIERFTSQTFLLRRHDAPAAWNGFSSDVAYEGQVSDGRLTGLRVNGQPRTDVAASWGAALDTVPGSNAERDQRNGQLNDELRATEAPPPLPDNEQAPCPADGYLWTPGYWGWRSAGYYWVPGLWVPPPRFGVLWTPGYWGLVGAVYVFHSGYWGPHVGYYGGINYGFGYGGVGFAGGRWVGTTFAYNRAVSNVSLSVAQHTYTEPVAVNLTARVSYHGGPGGTTAAPTAEERAAAAEAHIPPTAQQRQQLQQAASNPALTAHAFSGRPLSTAAPKPAVFHAPGVTPTHSSAPGAAPLAGQHSVARTAPHVAPHVAPVTPTPPARVAAVQTLAAKPAVAAKPMPSEHPHH